MSKRMAMVVLCVTAAPGVVSTAAAQNRASDTESWEVPRTPDGHPDLQGNWTNVTLTPFEREEGKGAVFTADEVARLEQELQERIIRGSEPSDPDRLAPTAGASVGTYNQVFFERGDWVAIVDGEPRSSLVTHPANGRRPSLTPEAERRIQEYEDFRSQFGQYDHPELRPLGERCIINSSTSNPAGPPMVPKTSYNGNFTIVQTADHVMIMTEMVHDTRISESVTARGCPHTSVRGSATLGVGGKATHSWSRPRTSIHNRLSGEPRPPRST